MPSRTHPRPAPRHCITLTSLLLVCFATSAAAACPFCPSTQPTLGERVARSDIVALAQWSSSTPAAGDQPGRSTFDLLQAAKAPPGIKPGRQLEIPLHVPAEQGEFFLLTGTQAELIDWDDPLPTTEIRYQYLVQAPSPETAADKRLAYYLKFLEFSDATVADDAYFEFAKAPYEDVAPLKDRLPRNKLRRWVADRNTPQHRLGLYGLMLGLCGNEDDAALMRQRILEPGAEFRLGIDGVIGGYLLLAGDEGLDLLDRSKLSNPEAPDSELYAALQALRFHWTYGDGRISKDRLKQSMRLVLARPTLAEFALRDLARWKDWTVLDRVVELYDDPALQPAQLQRAVRRSIAGYLIACTKDRPSDAAAAPAHVTAAQSHLATLRRRNPQLIREAERLLGPVNDSKR